MKILDRVAPIFHSVEVVKEALGARGGIRIGITVLAAWLMLGSSSLRAQTVAWSGSPGNSASDVNQTGNWAGKSLPTTGADVSFGLSTTTTVNYPVSFTVGNITFGNTGPTARPDYIFSGQSSAILTVGGGITVNVSGNVSGNGNVSLDSSLPVALTNGSHSVNVSSGPTLTVNGVVSDAVSAVASITKSGAGSLVLSGANTYSGGTTLSAGTLKVGSASALGTGTLTMANGTTLTNGITSLVTLANPIALSGIVTLGGSTNAGGNLALTGSISGTATLNVTSSTSAMDEDKHLTVFLRGNNSSFAGTVSVVASSLILDSANALPSGVAVKLDDDAYIGYTENSFSTFAAFKSAITSSGSSRTGDTVIGIDTASSRSAVTEAINLSGLNSPYFGSATSATVSGALSFSSSDQLKLTGVNGGYLKITSPLTTANNIASVSIGNSESEPGDVSYKGYVELSGASTYTGGTTFKSGYLLVGNNTALGTGTLAVSGTGDTGAPALAASANGIVLGNNISLSTTLQVGAPTTSTSTDFAFPLQSFTANSLTLAGTISGSGSLTYQGAGSLTLSGNNTYTGATTVSSGTLVADNTVGSATGAGSVTIGSGATLQLGNGGTSGTVSGSVINNGSFVVNRSDLIANRFIFANAISGTGSLTKNGTGFLSLTGSNSYGGGTIINGGWLSVGEGSSSGSIAGNVQINAGANLEFNRSDNVPFGGVISGAGSLTQFGTGILTLSGTNTFLGSTSITNGTLAISSDANLGAAPASPTPGLIAFTNFNGGTLESTASFTLSANRGISIGTSGGTFSTDPSTTLAYGGIIAGSGTLNKSGTGTLILSGSNSYTGGTTINAGELQLASSGSLSSGSDVTLNGSGVFHVFAPNQTIRDLISSSPTSSVIIETGATLTSNMPNTPPSNLSTFAGSLSGAGSFLKNGGISTLILTGNSSLTGLTTVGSGTLQIGNGGTTGGIAGNIAITSPGTLDFNRADLPSNPITYSSILSGNGLFVKDGTSTLIFNNPANTFSGSAVINTGTLVVGADNVVPNATVTVNSNGTFSVSNNATINSLSGTGTTTVASGKALTLSGVSTLSSIISGAGGVTFGSGINVVANQAYTGVTSIPSGVLIIGNSTATGAIAGNIATNPSSSIPSSVNVQNAGPSTYAGIISGAGSLSLNGPGDLTLTGVNTYTGATSVNGGALIVGVDNAVPNGFVSVGASGTFSVLNNETITALNGSGTTTVAANKTLTLSTGGPLSAVISGAGNVAISGVVTVTTNQTYTGDTILNNTGSPLTLNLGNNTTSGMVAGNIITTSAKTGVQFNRSDAVSYGGVISGGGFLNKNNSNMLTLTGGNTYTGNTTVNSGTLQIGTGGTTGSISGNIAVSSGAAVDFNRSDSIAFGSALSGGGSLIKDGSSTLTLTGTANTFFGNVIINSGTLSIGSANVFLFPSSIVSVAVASGATFDVANNTSIAALSGTGSIVVAGGKTLTFNSGGAVSSVISGTGNVSFTSGAGATITANQIYTGTTSILIGSLFIGSGGTTGSIAGNVSLGSSSSAVSIDFNRSDNFTYGGVISGSSFSNQFPSLVKSGAGTLTLTGQSTFLGTTQVAAGILRLGTTNTLPTVTRLDLLSGTTLDVASDQTIAGFGQQIRSGSNILLEAGKTLTVQNTPPNFNFFGGDVTGSGTLIVGSNATVGVVGNLTSTGGTTVSTGSSLGIGAGGTTGQILGNITNNGLVSIWRSDTTQYSGVISGSGSLLYTGSAFATQSGNGTLTLTGQSIYSGSTTVSSGTLKVGVVDALPTTTQLSLAASAVLDVLNNQTIAGFLTAGDLTSVLQLEPNATFTVAMPVANTSTTFAGTVNGSGTFAVSGAGGDVVNLTGPVAATVGASIGPGATLNIASGGSLAGPIALGPGSLLTFGNPGVQTFTNVISGPGGIISSAGTTTLTAPNTYTGNTIINGGKIIVSNTVGSATGTGNVTVTSGGILGGSGIITGNLTLAAGAIISPGNSPGLLTVGPTVFAASAGYTFDINSPSGTPGTNWDILNITGPLTIAATVANPFVINLVSLDSSNTAGLLANFNPAQAYSWQFVSTTGLIGFSAGAFQYNASQFQNSLAGGFFAVSQSGNNLFLNFTPVPEPSTWALLATGLGTLAFAAFRRRRLRS